jgi:biotin carboxyl carrier protein
MQYEVAVGGRPRKVVITSAGGGFAVSVDGRAWQVDARRIDRHTLSLLITAASPESDTRRSYESAFWRDPVSRLLTFQIGSASVAVAMDGRRREGPAQPGRGPQRIVAPMPGKVVRVLVKTGDIVGARQPIVVVEAMKMENELRASGEGTVAAIHVKEGASVDAGALLVELE